MRVTVPTEFGNRWRKGGDWNHNSPDATYHFYSAYGIGEDTSSLHTDKRKQDLDKPKILS